MAHMYLYVLKFVVYRDFDWHCMRTLNGHSWINYINNITTYNIPFIRSYAT